MISNSNLTIIWSKPDIELERWEFFTHPAKQGWYSSHNVAWEKIVSCFAFGTLIPYPRSEFIGDIKISLSYHSYEEYQVYLAKAKRGYRKSYSKMEDALQSTGSLTLPAPIILINEGDGLLFSGFRRLCLGWNYGMVPYIWLVNI